MSEEKMTVGSIVFGQSSIAPSTTSTKTSLGLKEGEHQQRFINTSYPGPDSEEYEKEYYLAVTAAALIKDAKELGYVVRIDLAPQEPLAMGNYEMIPEIRKARGTY